jgi:hypothetical protein
MRCALCIRRKLRAAATAVAAIPVMKDLYRCAVKAIAAAAAAAAVVRSSTDSHRRQRTACRQLAASVMLGKIAPSSLATCALKAERCANIVNIYCTMSALVCSVQRLWRRDAKGSSSGLDEVCDTSVAKLIAAASSCLAVCACTFMLDRGSLALLHVYDATVKNGRTVTDTPGLQRMPPLCMCLLCYRLSPLHADQHWTAAAAATVY